MAGPDVRIEHAGGLPNGGSAPTRIACATPSARRPGRRRRDPATSAARSSPSATCWSATTATARAARGRADRRGRRAAAVTASANCRSTTWPDPRRRRVAQASSEAVSATLPADVDLHARPAADFVRAAMGFGASVRWPRATRGRRQEPAFRPCAGREGRHRAAADGRRRGRRRRSGRAERLRRDAQRLTQSAARAARPRRRRRLERACASCSVSAWSSARTQPRTAPTRAAPALSSSRPEAHQQRESAGPTPPRRRPRAGFRPPARHGPCPRCGQHARVVGGASPWAKRSVPSVAWVRSLVPMLRNSHSARSRCAPPRPRAARSSPRLRSSPPSRARSARVTLTSPGVPTIGAAPARRPRPRAARWRQLRAERPGVRQQ